MGTRRRAYVAATVAVVLAAVAVVAFFFVRGDERPTEALAAPIMVDESERSGLDHAYTGGSTFFEGGGVAVFDCDGDTRPDVFLAGGSSASVLFRNTSEQGAELAFERVTSATEIELDSVTGAYPIDIDSDHVTDLAVLRVGENVLYRGVGDCRFERANEAWGFDGGDEWTVAFSATWEPDHVLPTLAFGNYLKLDDALNQDELCEPNVLVRPDGSTYAEPILLEPSKCSLSVLFSDWSRTGVADLRVTNDRQYYRQGEEQLWRIDTDPPVEYGRSDGWNRLQIWGMGIASHDVTGDGLPEIFLTSQGDNRLQMLASDASSPDYTDIAIRRGVTAHRPYVGDDSLPSTAWHPEFADVNNDGFIDLFVSKGNVDSMPEFTSSDPNNLFIGQPDGSFLEGGAEAGIVHDGKTRGAAVVDLNGDGLLDLIEVNRIAPVRVWRNVGRGTSTDPEPMGSWVDVVVNGSGINHARIGSWIEVRIGEYSTSDEITIGGGHASGSLGVHHFGLGPANKAEVRLVGPDGHTTPWQTVEAGRTIVIEVD